MSVTGMTERDRVEARLQFVLDADVDPDEKALLVIPLAKRLLEMDRDELSTVLEGRG